MNLEDFRRRIWPIKDRLYRFALRIVDNTAEAEDVVQEVMIKLWDQRMEMQGVDNLEAWMLRMTRNQAIDKLRGGYRQRKTDLEHAPDHMAPQDRPDRQTERDDTLSHIQQLMQRLPEAQRMVMHLRDIEGLSYQEICDTLQLSMPQVKTNLHRARQRLRETLLKTESYGL